MSWHNLCHCSRFLMLEKERYTSLGVYHCTHLVHREENAIPFTCEKQIPFLSHSLWLRHFIDFQEFLGFV